MGRMKDNHIKAADRPCRKQTYSLREALVSLVCMLFPGRVNPWAHASSGLYSLMQAQLQASPELRFCKQQWV